MNIVILYILIKNLFYKNVIEKQALYEKCPI
jgi:hypothetical protein